MRYFNAVHDKTESDDDIFMGQKMTVRRSLIEKIEKKLGIALWYGAKLPYPEDLNDGYMALSESEKDDRVLVCRATVHSQICAMERKLYSLKNIRTLLSQIDLKDTE